MGTFVLITTATGVIDAAPSKTNNFSPTGSQSVIETDQGVIHTDWSKIVYNSTASSFELLPAQAIKNEYSIHREAGIEYFNNYRASVVEDMIAETITEADAIALDRTLVAVKCFIIDGDWKTGRAELTDVVVDSVFTQTMKDSILSDFNTYIANNY